MKPMTWVEGIDYVDGVIANIPVVMAKDRDKALYYISYVYYHDMFEENRGYGHKYVKNNEVLTHMDLTEIIYELKNIEEAEDLIILNILKV